MGMMDPGGAEVSHLAQKYLEAPSTSVGRAGYGRGWVVRRALACADVIGLSLAFALSTIFFADKHPLGDHVRPAFEVLLFACTLPVWIVFAKILGLYDRDDARADHSTADEAL